MGPPGASARCAPEGLTLSQRDGLKDDQPGSRGSKRVHEERYPSNLDHKIYHPYIMGNSGFGGFLRETEASLGDSR